MASTGKCEYCASTVLSNEKVCPHCGAANPNYVEEGDRTVFLPKTIEELRDYCAQRRMPLLRMRFFIGENYKEPKAFGIYQDGADFIVYKNKSDGSRSIRYEGPDEAFAVQELFYKLQEECSIRGIYPDGKGVTFPAGGSGSGNDGNQLSPTDVDRLKKKTRFIFISTIALIAATGLVVTVQNTIGHKMAHRSDGYYEFNDDSLYYRYEDDWFAYSDDSSWVGSDAPEADDYSRYYLGKEFDSDWKAADFERSGIPERIEKERQERSEREKSDNSGGFDSWDAGTTDWDSDW